MTSAALVTRVPCHSLITWWQPADRSEVIGPGTAISRRRRSLACRAVLSAPLRWAASTTSVPVASAAMTRLRTRNLSLLTCRPGGHSLTSTPWAAIASNSSAWAARVGHVHAAGEHRDGHAVGAERAPVRRGVDPEGAAGDHRQAARGDGRGELGRHVGAVGGRGPRADDRDRAQAAEPQVRVAAQPQRVGLVIPEVGQLPGPFRVARARRA